MSRIRLYLDEDTIKGALIQALRNADLDIITVADADRLGYPDEEQLIWAVEQGRVIYSFNIRDFCRLHGEFVVQQRCHAGIVLAPQQQYSVGQQLRGLLKLAADKSAKEMANQLVFLNAYIEKTIT
ncbi:hypothetical protein SAMD00079811_65480 [Scytonema sp. HK-05]|uniref:DUF5615 family PIN-like protein n=1 Tax=Scytonema sp. HK-05 TaxID=1137095 RepID=UPI000935E2CC|nr:DUF5615 family PIN-like protein [Scytonema sp. HK-05]OKH43844.1 hypothetical protein NIES2130_38405 [Scytonema sp. HK-05]BAY48919.1 hypothetical protein SAMD00079811_65480 [Scytonema sp. HK-05]